MNLECTRWNWFISVSGNRKLVEQHDNMNLISCYGACLLLQICTGPPLGDSSKLQQGLTSYSDATRCLMVYFKYFAKCLKIRSPHGQIETFRKSILHTGEKKNFKCIRKLPIALDKDIKTAFGEANGPNVMTRYEDEAINFTVDSFCKSTWIEKKWIGRDPSKKIVSNIELQLIT